MIRDENMLQDFLDGRLSDEERAGFEARMRDDADLAKRVDSARQIREALREDPEELSPGFYARARERFEQTTGRKRRAGWRLLSWEAAGLAAATALALVLFVPGVLRDSGSDLEPSLTEPVAEGVLEEVAAEPPAVGLDEPRRLETPLADKDDAELAPRMKKKAPGKGAAAGRRDQPSPVGEKQVVTDPVEMEYAPEPEPVAREPRDAKEGFGVAGAAPQSPPSPERADEVTKSRDAEPKRRTRAGYSMESDALEKNEARLEMIRGPRVVDLSRDVAVPDEFLVVEDPSEWRTWAAGPAKDALAVLGDPDPASRLVLMSPEGGVDCSTIAVVLEGDRYVVHYYALTSPRSIPGGCALLLPNDGRAVHRERHD